MFGANDSTQTSNDDPAMLDNIKQLASEPADQVTPQQPQFMTTSAPTPNPFAATPAATPTTDDSTSTTPATETPVADNPQPEPAIAEPAQGFSSAPIPDSTTTDSTAQADTPVTSQPTDDSAAPDQTSDNAPIAAATAVAVPVDTEQLAGMKQQALDHLEPLVGHLDQSPEEAFKTTMMMIQANDNHTLLEKALEEAKKIEDDKIRANAMLDIINEINYFSQTNN
jgi:hypothetical protein